MHRAPRRKRGSRAIHPPPIASGSDDASDQQTDAQPQPAAAGTPAAVVAEQVQPPVKRTRREQRDALAAAAAASAVAAAAVAPMMRLLKKDVHAVHSVLRMLSLVDLYLLTMTCRTWREWIEHPPAHLLEAFSLACGEIEPYQMRELALSPIRAYVTELHPINPSPSTHATTSVMLLALSLCTRLTALKIELSHPAVDITHLRLCFAALAGRLTHLNLRVSYHKSLSALVLSEVSVLRRLRGLQLTTTEGIEAQKVDLSFLTSLPALEIFHLNRGLRFSCSFAQAQTLAQCKSLTEITCGVWSTVMENDDPPAATEQFKDHRIGTLVRGQLAAMRERGLSVPPLTNLWLLWTTIDSTALDQLLQLQGLTSLMPIAWSNDITPAQWSRLPEWKQLKEISIGGSERKTLSIERFLSSLLQCSHLEYLRIDEAVALSSVQLRDLCAQLTKLTRFHLSAMAIESLKPLEALADRCTELSFYDCTGPGGVPLNVRSNLPAMPQLIELGILEPRGHRLEQWVGHLFNHRLLTRCPKLDIERFEQNLVELSDMEDEQGSDFEQDD